MRTSRRWFLPAASLLAGGILLGGALLAEAASPPSARSSRQIEADLRFAADMAAQGLWREAMFRWERVLKDRPSDPRILNNVAVAAEALGQLDKAKEAYEKAAALSKDRQVAANYELFLRRTAERLC